MDKNERDALFESKYEVILQALKTRRHKWRLSSLSYMNYDDVTQIILLHFYNKIHLYDHSKPFINWCQKTISNRMINIGRDNYGYLAPPCNKCPYNEGDNRCGFTSDQTKNGSCPAYSKWEKSKKVGYQLKFAQSLDHPDFIEQRVNAIEVSDLETRKEKMIEDFYKTLDEQSLIVFKYIFLGDKTDKEINKEHGLSLNDIKKIKATIVSQARRYLENDE